jgi:hypothetical protein
MEMLYFDNQCALSIICKDSMARQYVEIKYFRMNYLLLIINGNIAVTEVKCWVTESVLDLFSVCMTCSLFIKGYVMVYGRCRAEGIQLIIWRLYNFSIGFWNCFNSVVIFVFHS